MIVLSLISFPPLQNDSVDFLDSSLRIQKDNVYFIDSMELLAEGISKFRTVKYRHGQLFILKSSNTLEIYNSHNIVTADAILGFEVLWSGEMILILVSGLEFYSFKNGLWEKFKKIDIMIHWYSIHQNIILLSSSQSRVFPVFSLKQGHVVSRLESLTLDIQVSEMEMIHKKNFLIYYMKSDLFIGFLDFKSGSLIIYKHSKGKIINHKTLNISDCPIRDVSFVNDGNSLLVINTSTKEFKVFDVFTTQNSNPVYKGIIDIGTQDGIQIVSGLLKNQVTGLYYSMCINYKQLSRDGFPSSGLVSIVIPQMDSKEYIIYILLEMMKNGVSCKELCSAFSVIHSYPVLQFDKHQSSVFEHGNESEKASPSVLSLTMKFVGSIYGFSENKINNEIFVLNQEDMFALVFSCLSESDNIPHRLADYVYVYIRSLLDTQQIPAPFLSELLGKLYIRENRISELNAMIKHGMLVESATLALSLIGTPGNASFQEGLDMLKRLNENEHVVSTFLGNNMILEALEFISCVDQPGLVTPFQFLELSYRSGNKNLFFTVYKFLEDGGMISETDERLNLYVSIFREMWADFVYLEDIDFN